MPDGLIQWIARKGYAEAESIKESAGDRGSRVHNAINDLLQGKKVLWNSIYYSNLDKIQKVLTNDEYSYLLSFQKFWETEKPFLVENESVVYSDKYGFAGTIDAVVLLDGKLTILDWKTSSRIHVTHQMQVAAYAYASHEMGRKVAQTGIVRLGTRHKNGGYEIKLFNGEETKKSFSRFLSVKDVFEIEHQKEEPDIVQIPEFIELKVERKTVKL